MVTVRDLKDKKIFEFDKHDYKPLLLIKEVIKEEYFSVEEKNELINFIMTN